MGSDMTTYRDGEVTRGRSTGTYRTREQLAYAKMQLARSAINTPTMKRLLGSSLERAKLHGMMREDGLRNGPFEAILETRAVEWPIAFLSLRVVEDRWSAISAGKEPPPFSIHFDRYVQMNLLSRESGHPAILVVGYPDCLRIASLPPKLPAVIGDHRCGHHAGKLIAQVPAAEWKSEPVDAAAGGWL